MGSSTKLATPDDIARMVKEDLSKINQCEIEISLNIRQNASGDIDFHALEINVTDDEEIIADGGQNVSYQPWMRKAITFSEKVDWLRDVLRTIRVDIALENQSALSAEQLQIETKITKCSNDCINEVEHFPSRPSEIPFSSMPHITTKNLLRNVSLHPGQYDNSSSSLYFEVTHCGSFTLNVTVFGKNMPPFHKEFTINVDYIPISFNSDQINKCFELIQNEDASFLFWDFIRKNIADLLPSPGPQNDDGERERKDQTEYEEP